MKVWEVKHNTDVIRVENYWDKERLYVNDVLQDEQNGLAHRSRLFGKTSLGEDVKVSLGGVWTMQCTIFVDNKLLISE